MRTRPRRTARRAAWAALPALAGTALLAPPSFAAEHGGGRGGPSTPGVTVTAQDPGGGDGGLRLTLTAHTDAEATPHASIVARFDGHTVKLYEAHHVAVGDTGCTGHDDAVLANDDEGVRAVVRGVAQLDDGSAVQVWVDLKDVGSGQYVDQARVRIRPAPVHEELAAAGEEDGGCGGGQGWDHDTGWRTVQQVQVHQAGWAG